MQRKGLLLRITVWVFCTALLLQSCKSVSVLPSKAPAENIELKRLRKKIISKYPVYKNLKIRVKTKYDDGKREQQLTVQLRMQEEKAIWLSATMLIPIAKMMITSKGVSFYEKFQKTFFEGDFTFLNQFVNGDVDLKKVESILLGTPISDLNKGKWKRVSNPQYYILTPESTNEKWRPIFFFDPTEFLLKEQRIFIPELQRQISIRYRNHQLIESTKIPRNVEITVFDGEALQKLELEYTRATFPKTITMPFQIPEGYQKIKWGFID